MTVCVVGKGEKFAEYNDEGVQVMLVLQSVKIINRRNILICSTQ